MSSPTVNDAPFYVTHFASLSSSEQFIEAASRRATTILGILGECYRAFNTVSLELSSSLVRQWPRISESNIGFVGRGIGVQLIEKLGHCITLKLSITQDGRTTTNVFILFLDLRCSPAGNERCNHTLKRQRYQVTVREKVGEKILRFCDLSRICHEFHSKMLPNHAYS